MSDNQACERSVNAGRLLGIDLRLPEMSSRSGSRSNSRRDSIAFSMYPSASGGVLAGLMVYGFKS